MKENKKTYSVLENAALPTNQQTEKMLDQIMFENSIDLITISLRNGITAGTLMR